MDNQTVQFLIVGLLGVIFHSILKANSLMQDARVANLQFNFVRDYIQKDWLAIAASLCSVIIWLYLFKEIAAKYESLQGFALTSFFVMGVMGSYLIQLALSRAKKQIRSVVDLKTNLADGVQPPVTDDNIKGVADAAKDGQL